eukprot:643911-Amphidinium_carterae.1
MCIRDRTGPKQPHLTSEQVELLAECADFFEEGKLDKESFMDLLMNLLELNPRTQQREWQLWEKEVQELGAVSEEDFVDMPRFIARFRSRRLSESFVQGSDEHDHVQGRLPVTNRECHPPSAARPGACARAESSSPREEGEDQPPNAACLLPVTREAGEDHRPASAARPEASATAESSWTLSTAIAMTAGELRRLLESREVEVGTAIAVGSKEYVIGGKLGKGGFGSVHQAIEKKPVAQADDALDVDIAPNPHPYPLAVKLVGSIGARGYRNEDLKLAAMAVE